MTVMNKFTPHKILRQSAVSLSAVSIAGRKSTTKRFKWTGDYVSVNDVTLCFVGLTSLCLLFKAMWKEALRDVVAGTLGGIAGKIIGMLADPFLL